MERPRWTEQRQSGSPSSNLRQERTGRCSERPRRTHLRATTLKERTCWLRAHFKLVDAARRDSRPGPLRYTLVAGHGRPRICLESRPQ
jgi:hypothetical protein